MKRLPLYEKLYKHQKGAVKFCLERDAAALFLDPRVGKTYITGGVIEQIAAPGFYALCVVPLTNLETTWVKLFENELPDMEVRFDLSKPDPETPTVVLLSYEQAVKLRRKLSKIKWSLVVFDESHRLKARGNSWSRMAASIKFTERRMILSGTPVEKAPQDVWAQFRFLAVEVFGKKWTWFKSEYLRPSGFMGYKLKFREEKMKKLMRKIEPYSLRITKEMAGIKAAKFKIYPVELYGKQRELYKQINKEMVGEWEGHEIDSDLKITQNVLLQQITGGFVRDVDGEDHWVGDAKIRKLRRILRKSAKPTVIFCKYLWELDRIEKLCDEMGFTHATIKGKNKRTRARVITDFQKGAYDVLISQQRTGGVGVDMFHGKEGVMYSFTYSYIDFEQAQSRLDCIGKDEHPQFHLLYVKNTIDEGIFKVIFYEKKPVSNKMLNQLRRTYNV